MPGRTNPILIAEDDEATRAKPAGYLEAAGHRVSDAADGTEMRSRSEVGIGLVRRLRRLTAPDPKNPEIIVTAHGEGYVFAAEMEAW